jgi:hypothetical protein
VLAALACVHVYLLLSVCLYARALTREFGEYLSARRYLGASREAKLPDVEQQIQSPACRAGGMILYDYRTIHRGAPNPEVGGRERPVAYVLVSVPGGGRDTYNFPESSVFGEVAPETEFPFFRETQKSGASFAPLCPMLSAPCSLLCMCSSDCAPPIQPRILALDRCAPKPPTQPHIPRRTRLHGKTGRAAAYEGSEDSLSYNTELQGPDRYAIPIQFACLKWGLGAGAANLFSKLAKLVLSVEQGFAR